MAWINWDGQECETASGNWNVPNSGTVDAAVSLPENVEVVKSIDGVYDGGDGVAIDDIDVAIDAGY